MRLVPQSTIPLNKSLGKAYKIDYNTTVVKTAALFWRSSICVSREHFYPTTIHLKYKRYWVKVARKTLLDLCTVIKFYIKCRRKCDILSTETIHHTLSNWFLILFSIFLVFFAEHGIFRIYMSRILYHFKHL